MDVEKGNCPCRWSHCDVIYASFIFLIEKYMTISFVRIIHLLDVYACIYCQLCTPLDRYCCLIT